MLTEIQKKELFNAIEAAKVNVKNEYAKAYLFAIDTYNLEGRELGVQLLYCLNNMQGWKGADARRVKEIFKLYAKELTKGD